VPRRGLRNQPKLLSGIGILIFVVALVFLVVPVTVSRDGHSFHCGNALSAKTIRPGSSPKAASNEALVLATVRASADCRNSITIRRLLGGLGIAIGATITLRNITRLQRWHSGAGFSRA
jgi:hypothetical protein